MCVDARGTRITLEVEVKRESGAVAIWRSAGSPSKQFSRLEIDVCNEPRQESPQFRYFSTGALARAQETVRPVD